MVNWNAEKDQIILKGIFKFHDIKSSAPLLKYLADEIGENCTPKAVSHRLNNIRSHGKPLANGGGRATSTPRKPKVNSTPKTPGSRMKSGSKKKNVSESDDSEGPQGLLEDDEEIITPSAARGKRKLSTPKHSYTESDHSDNENETEYVPFAKRVKTEPVEDGPLMDDESAAEV